jgi:hypothetical protein
MRDKKIPLVIISVYLVSILYVYFANSQSNKNFSQSFSPLGPRNLSPQSASPPGSISQAFSQRTDAGGNASLQGPITGWATVHDVSPALKDIPLPPEKPAVSVRPMGEPDEMEKLGTIGTRPQIEDPVLQRDFGRLSNQALAPTPVADFDGLTNLDGVYPPDPNGDVGPNHYVQMVNLHFQIFDKNGVSLYGPAANNTLWTGFGAPCETNNPGDPLVLYDSIADRWILSQFTATNPYGECVAVSTSPDPTGTYYRYFFQFSASVFYDYPKLGVWPDGYYLTALRFGGLFQTFLGSSAIALDRTSMLQGQAANFIEFQTATTYGALLPSDLDGPTLPPAGEPDFVAEIGSAALHLWKYHVDWLTPANSSLSGPATLNVAAYNTLCLSTRNCVPQPGTSVGLDGIGDRLMHRLAYRNFGAFETLVVSHNVNAVGSGTRAGVRWYEIRNPNGAATIYQQGTYSPDTDSRWMGSLAMDGSGDIALAYSVSSAATFPSIRYTGRLAGDSLGLMTQGEVTMIAGTGSQTGSASRWGDYTSMSIDPTDDCTFWFTSEYLATTGTAPWRTRIGSFRLPGCGGTPPTPTSTPTATATQITTNTLTRTATATPTPTATHTPIQTATVTPTSSPTLTASTTPTATLPSSTNATSTPTPTVTPTQVVGLPPKSYLPWIGH